ncbi:MAG: tetratricopeptide repeat protein [Acidobacteria bacterium]|nr:tetratricopeptide repeat protein [Acidobacteriota bacterium]
MPKRAVPLLLAILTLAVFWPALDNQFVNWDDDKNVLNNTRFRGLEASNLRWMWTTFHLGHYHPLTWMSLGFDYTLWGLDPKGYHLTNVVLHAANAALFYLVALRLAGGRVFTAAVAALLFALHPLRVESVAWVSERRDVLSGLFYLLSVLAYLGRRVKLSLAAFAAALLSKEIVVSLPVVLLVLDVYPLRRGPRWREKIPYFLLAAAAALAAVALQPAGVSGLAEHATVLPSLRVGLSLYGLAFYLWKTVWPFGLYPQYVLTGSVVAGAAVAIAVTALVAALGRRFPALPAVWICYVVSLLPVLSIFRVDPQQFVANHHTYLATLGFALLVAVALGALPPRVATGAAVVAVLGLTVLTGQQIPVWRDPLSLWTRTLAGAPQSVVAHNNLGEALAAQNRLDEAIPHFEQALRIKPADAHALYNLGNAHQRHGDVQAAVQQFERAIQVEPTFAAAHNDLANCYTLLGRTDQAVDHYRRALAAQPGFADAHYNLGNLLQQQGRLEEAVAHYEQAVVLKPTLADAHNNWGVALDALGRPREAVEHYRQALLLDPRNADAHNNLGVSLESEGKRDEALVHYRQAVQLNPMHPDAARNLERLAGQVSR